MQYNVYILLIFSEGERIEIEILNFKFQSFISCDCSSVMSLKMGI